MGSFSRGSKNTMKANTDFLLDVLRLEYTRRINEVLGEADVFDDKGNLVIAPDLKVRHKKSGYEYTVGHVEGDEDGKVKIILREPEEPRFEPPPGGEEILGGPDDGRSLNEQDDELLLTDPRVPDLLDPTSEPEEVADPVAAIASLVDEEPKEEIVFIVDQEEFEKEYEVD